MNIRLDPLVFVPNAFYTFLCNYGLLQNRGLRTCFGLKLNRGLNNAMIFYAKHRLTQKLCFTQTQCFTQIYVLARPVQALLAASRIAMTVMTMMMMMMMTMTMMSRRTTVTRVTMVMSVMMAMMTIMTVITMMTTMLLVEIDSYSTFTFVGKICSRIM